MLVVMVMAVMNVMGQSFTWDELVKMANKGDTKAQITIGQFYYYGENGIEQDYAEAFKWYKKAADAGSSVGEYRVGFCYQKGQGVPQNPQEAIKWYKKSAKQGDEGAIANLKAKGITEYDD